ncbi:apolipoprotein N-acyltransferase [Streptomyces sp. NPDC006339]|uniref:apolipoprotein N-acyltransferase n=1 Tax=Streptomyces sp. NPDC006339 TaxID=3156755 RepID=UPI0033A73CCC
MRTPFARRSAPAGRTAAAGQGPGATTTGGGTPPDGPTTGSAPRVAPARSRLPGLGRSALAVVLGALPALAFPAPGLWWWAYLALVPWLLLIARAPSARRAGLDGWCGGIGVMLAVHHWLMPSLHVFMLLLAALLGLLWLPWGRLVHALLGGPPSARRAAAALLAVPSGWLLIELVRSWEGLGGPWGLLGASQWQVPAALRLASIGGIWLVSLLVVAVNTAVALLVTAAPLRRTAPRGPTAPVSRPIPADPAAPVSPTAPADTTTPMSRPAPADSTAPVSRPTPADPAPADRPTPVSRPTPPDPRAPADPSTPTAHPTPLHRTALVGLVGLLGCALLLGLGWWGTAPPRTAGTVRVAVVQPGVLDPPGGAERRFARGEELTRTLAGQRLDLVVWGESSVGADLRARPDLAARLTALSRAVDAPVLVNVDARRSDRPGIFKSAILVDEGGPTGDRYDKMRLVPFGEYIPARAVLGWVTSVGKAAGEDRRRGTAPVVMTLPAPDGGDRPALRVGPLVCFESAFPDMTRRLARDGADVVVAQSATSTFQESWAPAQHASLAALRAAESGRPVVHATLTGISAAYGPDGRPVGDGLGTGASAVAVRELPLSGATTPYVRLGDWPVHAAVGVLVLLGAVGVAGRLRRPGRVPRAPRARTVRGSGARRGR